MEDREDVERVKIYKAEVAEQVDYNSPCSDLNQKNKCIVFFLINTVSWRGIKLLLWNTGIWEVQGLCSCPSFIFEGAQHSTEGYVCGLLDTYNTCTSPADHLHIQSATVTVTMTVKQTLELTPPSGSQILDLRF